MQKYLTTKVLFLFITFLSFVYLLSVTIIFIFNAKITANYDKFDKYNTITSNSSSKTPSPVYKLIENFYEDYDYPQTPQEKGTVRIPILNYHHIAPLTGKIGQDAYFVSPEMFEKQMEYLYKKGYKTLTPEEFFEQLKKGENPAQKSVMITFDDGNIDCYKNAFPVLKKYNMTAVFYIVSKKSGISVANLKEMSEAGMSIHSHSATHIDLRFINDNETLYSEIVSSKNWISSVTGKAIISFSYPGCGSSPLVISTLKENNYQFAVSCGKTIDHKYTNRFTLSRIHVYNNFENFKKILSGICETTFDYSE